MKYSFIVPCHNSESTITHCLQSILAQFQFFPNGFCELIVVDNASDDMTNKKIKEFGIRPIEVSKKSRATARNAGAQIAKGEYLCFIDSDIQLAPNWLKQVETILLEEPECQVIDMPASPLLVVKQNTANLYNYELESIKSKILKIGEDYVFVNTKSCIYKKSFFEKLMGFDEDIYWYEDLDLSRRLLFESGMVVFEEKKMSLILDIDTKFSTLLKKAYFSGRETPFYYFKWSDEKKLKIFIRMFKRGWGIRKHFKNKNESGLTCVANFCFLSYCLGLFHMVLSDKSSKIRNKASNVALRNNLNLTIDRSSIDIKLLGHYYKYDALKKSWTAKQNE